MVGYEELRNKLLNNGAYYSPGKFDLNLNNIPPFMEEINLIFGKPSNEDKTFFIYSSGDRSKINEWRNMEISKTTHPTLYPEEYVINSGVELKCTSSKLYSKDRFSLKILIENEPQFAFFGHEVERGGITPFAIFLSQASSDHLLTHILRNEFIISTNKLHK